MNDLEARAASLLALLEDSAPQAIEHMVYAVWINSVGGIISGFVFLGLSVVAAMIGSRLLRNHDEDLYSDDFPWFVIAYGVAALCALVAFICLLSGWNWVGMFDPETRLVHELVTR